MSLSTTSLAAFGAPELTAPSLLAALEPEVTQRYALQWEPGLQQSPHGGAPLSLKWVSWAEKGTWVVVPQLNLARLFSHVLAGKLDTPLTILEAQWFAEDSYTRVTNYQCIDVQLENIETIEHEEIVPEQALHLSLGTTELVPQHQHSINLYPLARPSNPVNTQPSQAPGSINAQRLAMVLELAQHAPKYELIREDAENYLFKAKASGELLSRIDDSGLNYPAEQLVPMNIYLNPATAKALQNQLASGGQVPAIVPSLWGPLAQNRAEI